MQTLKITNPTITNNRKNRDTERRKERKERKIDSN
jgi:hypothetical protein